MLRCDLEFVNKYVEILTLNYFSQNVKLATGEILELKMEVQQWHVRHARQTDGVIQP